MSLTRSMLKGMQLTEEQVSAIIEEHSNTVQGLKEEIKKYKAEADKLPDIQKELDELKNDDGNNWKSKYEQEHEDFEQYKKDVANKETVAKIKSAYRKLLVDSGVGDKHVDAVLRVTDFKDMKLDKEGKLENTDKLTESIKSEWSGFITNTGTRGADVANPPGGNAQMTKEAFEKMPLNERMEYANAHPAEVAPFLK